MRIAFTSSFFVCGVKKDAMALILLGPTKLRWPTTATPKEKRSRQKKKPHVKRKNLTPKEKGSRQKKKPHAKRKNLTPKEKRSRQKKKPHAKRKKATPNEKASRQKQNLQILMSSKFDYV